MPSAAILPRRMTGAGPQARVSRQALLGPPLPAGRCRRRPSELASREVAQHPRPNLQTPSRSNETSWAGTTWSVCPRTPASLLARAEGSPPRTRAAGPGESCAHSWSLSTRLPSPGLEVTLQKRSLAGGLDMTRGQHPVSKGLPALPSGASAWLLHRHCTSASLWHGPARSTTGSFGPSGAQTPSEHLEEQREPTPELALPSSHSHQLSPGRRLRPAAGPHTPTEDTLTQPGRMGAQSPVQSPQQAAGPRETCQQSLLGEASHSGLGEPPGGETQAQEDKVIFYFESHQMAKATAGTAAGCTEGCTEGCI